MVADAGGRGHAVGWTDGAAGFPPGSDVATCDNQPLAPEPASMDAEKLFLDQLPLIERVIASVCRRNGCWGDEAEEFAATVKLRLVDDGYRVLRRFKGRSSLATYLTTVVHNLFRDHRIARWGKWRPSAVARRMGPVAVQLEVLTRRDGRSLSEAVEILRANFGVTESAPALERLAEQLPARVGRRVDGEEALADLAADDGVVEQGLRDRERARAHDRTQAALTRAIAALDPEDRLLLRLRFQDGLTVAAIAGALGFKPRALYSRYERTLRAVRAAMEGEGASAADVAELLGWEGSELAIDYDAGSPAAASVQPEGES